VNLCEKWLQKYLFNKETRLLESIQMGKRSNSQVFLRFCRSTKTSLVLDVICDNANHISQSAPETLPQKLLFTYLGKPHS